MSKKLHPVSADDLYLIRQSFSCMLSPDGTNLLTEVVDTNREQNAKYRNLYLQPVKGGAIRRFTQTDKYDTNARFSPDGKRIAFLSNRSGRMQVHMMHTDGGESWQLTKLEGNAGDYCWAPDGRSLCVVVQPLDEEAKKRETAAKQGKKGMDEPVFRHITNLRYKADGGAYPPQTHSELHIVNAATGKSKLLFKDDFDNYGPTYTPDGKWVVFESNKHPNYELEYARIDLFKIRADGKGKVRKIETFDGPSMRPAISPDGKWIAFRGFKDPNLLWCESPEAIHVVSINGGKPRNLAPDLDRTANNLSLNDTWGHISGPGPMWNTDGSEIYSVVTTDGSTEIYRFDVEHGGGSPLFAEPGVVLDFDIDFKKRKLYCLLSTIDNPGDLVAKDLDGGKLKCLSRLNGWIGKRDLGNTEELWVRGGDSNKVQGWVTTPPDFDARKKYPAILYIHGGPHMAYSRSFFHEFQYLAGLGYIVLYCNPRGSQGYGSEFCSCIGEGWGDKDYRDLMKFTDAMLRKYKNIDKDRIGVTGGSYGGYMTNWIIGHTHRFKAAVTQRSVSNFFSFLGSSDCGYLFHEVFRYKDRTPWQEIDRFLELSPMTHIVNAKTPTLIIHSEGDFRTPIEQGEQVYIQLKSQGVETEMIRFPGESHELSRSGRTDRRIERLKRISGWFDRFLKK